MVDILASEYNQLFIIFCRLTGGLLSFGAPWETPAMYNIIEAVMQLRGEAIGRQVPNAKRALVYGEFLNYFQ